MFTTEETEAKTPNNNNKVIFSRSYVTANNLDPGEISSSKETIIDPNDSFNYGPFDTIVITNSDEMKIGVNLDENENNRIVVPPGMVISGSGQKFNSFNIINLDGSLTHTAGEVSILVQKTRP